MASIAVENRLGTAHFGRNQGATFGGADFLVPGEQPNGWTRSTAELPESGEHENVHYQPRPHVAYDRTVSSLALHPEKFSLRLTPREHSVAVPYENSAALLVAVRPACFRSRHGSTLPVAEAHSRYSLSRNAIRLRKRETERSRRHSGFIVCPPSLFTIPRNAPIVAFSGMTGYVIVTTLRFTLPTCCCPFYAADQASAPHPCWKRLGNCRT